jgi:hypothetical protein
VLPFILSSGVPKSRRKSSRQDKLKGDKSKATSRKASKQEPEEVCTQINGQYMGDLPRLRTARITPRRPGQP